MLELTNISKQYITGEHTTETVKNFSLTVKDREFVALVGPSGCGKTTILKLVAGLIDPSGGEMRLDGETISEPSKDRGMVFQAFSLFPWLSVRENIQFGLDLQNLPQSKKTKIVDHYLKVTGLGQFADFYPKQLSGGMQQRVAIARTLANNPKMLLMDEPFAALDSQTRSHMQEFLSELWEEDHKTVLLVTHDIEEAIFLADRVIVLSGRPAQIKKEFKITFPRPRTHDLKLSQDFFELKKKIGQLL